MKLLCFLVALGIAQAGTDAPRPELAEIHTVYILPMSSALDQFLAIRLTQAGILQVVTDPKKADAILSDHIGTPLEEKLDALYPDAKPAPIKEKDKDADKDADKDKNDAKDTPSFIPPGGGGRSKGAIFLVDRKTRNVLWSDYVRPKNSNPDEMNHVADKIATQLEKDKKGKKEKSAQ